MTEAAMPVWVPQQSPTAQTGPEVKDGAGEVPDNRFAEEAARPSAMSCEVVPPNPVTLRIEKSALALPEPKRIRSREHLKFVASQPCLICARTPSQAHHLRFAQPRALGRKVSDEFTVPLCATHHHELHMRGNERQWWQDKGIEPIKIAEDLWFNSEG